MSTTDRMTLIIPVYNESKSIGLVLAELLDYPFSVPIKVIVIDDGSTDGTPDVLKEYGENPQVKIIRHIFNRGYGASLKTGIRAADTQWVATYDGDGQFRPEDIDRFWKEATDQSLDVIIGVRPRLSAGSSRMRAPGKYFIRLLINHLTNVKITDFNCGLRLVKRQIILKYLHLCSDHFSFSTTSTLILINRGYSFKFSPVTIRSRMNGVSTVSLSSGFSTIHLVLKMVMLFNPLKIFFYSGSMFLMLGLLWGGNYFLAGKGLSIGAFFLLISSLLFFFLGLIADQIAEIRKSQFEHE